MMTKVFLLMIVIIAVFSVIVACSKSSEAQEIGPGITIMNSGSINGTDIYRIKVGPPTPRHCVLATNSISGGVALSCYASH